MGRSKRRLELLSNPRERRQSFQKRMEGLKKKANELKTLCNVDVCLIVCNEPKAEKCSHLIENLQTWPADRDLIKQLIASHRSQPVHDRSTRSVDLSAFLEAEKIEAEIRELKEKNKDTVYPTWDDRYNVLTKEKLERFGGLLGQKLQNLTTRMEAMRRISRTHQLEVPRDSDYFQEQTAAQNGLYFACPTSSMKSKTGRTYDSFELTAHRKNQVCAEHSVESSSIENGPRYTQLEDLFSSEFMSGLMEGPITDNFELLVPDHECYF